MLTPQSFYAKLANGSIRPIKSVWLQGAKREFNKIQGAVELHTSETLGCNKPALYTK